MSVRADGENVIVRCTYEGGEGGVRSTRVVRVSSFLRLSNLGNSDTSFGYVVFVFATSSFKI